MFIFVLVILVWFVGAFLRFYKLNSIPMGLNKDESAIAYNAYSIKETGKDEHGIKNPLYFKSYGDYKMPVYIYGTRYIFHVFGVNEFSVRFLSAFFGTVSLLFIFLFTYELTRKIMLSITSMILLTINPWHLFFSHAAFEVNVALCFTLLGSYCLLLARRKKFQLLFMLCAVFFFAVSSYTYNVSRVVSPFILVSFILFFYTDLKSIKRSVLVGFILLFLILLSPLFIAQDYREGLYTQQHVLITGVDYSTQIMQMRSNLSELPSLLTKLLFNNFTLIVWQYIKNVFRLFSVDFFFINGSSHLINGIGNVGMLYLFELPALIIGMISLIKRHDRSIYPVLLWLGVIVVVGSLVLEVPNATRHYFILIPFIILSAYGLNEIVWYIFRLKRPLLLIHAFLFGSFIAYSVIFFLINFFYIFPLKSADPWRAIDKQVVNDIQKSQSYYKKIIFDDRVDFAYTSFLFYSLYPPNQYHKEAVYKKNGLLLTLEKAGKYEFHTVDWKKEYVQGERKLFITTANPIPENKPILRIYKLPEQQIVTAENGKLFAFPYAEPKYSFVEQLMIFKQ